MKKKKMKKKLVIAMSLLLLTTGCTKTLTDSNKQPVKNERTGQTLTENIICRPTNKETSKLYEKNKTVIEKAAKKHGKKSSDHGHWIWPGTKLTIP